MICWSRVINNFSCDDDVRGFFVEGYDSIRFVGSIFEDREICEHSGAERADAIVDACEGGASAGVGIDGLVES